MAYTNTWSETAPLGTADANTIDDLFRALKVDVRERINSLLGVAIATALADPVTPVTASLANALFIES